jgi:hypothetical protein
VDIAQSLLTAGNEITANLLASDGAVARPLRAVAGGTDIELHGVRISKGSRVLLMRAAAKRDDEVFLAPAADDRARARVWLPVPRQLAFVPSGAVTSTPSSFPGGSIFKMEKSALEQTL